METGLKESFDLYLSQRQSDIGVHFYKNVLPLSKLPVEIISAKEEMHRLLSGYELEVFNRLLELLRIQDYGISAYFYQAGMRDVIGVLNILSENHIAGELDEMLEAFNAGKTN
jgi:hypothetical protein